eukprot:TRINITY_DN1362_c0_g1_i1.p1 TRINITY_DN1362_c0_g1~~TRINITY_DN1362_c0_g1_i1.p1  ORF type:complete len:791 (-),score=170.74 TRINITY_DN1362_c0_g1_i1:127-2499(-)
MLSLQLILLVLVALISPSFVRVSQANEDVELEVDLKDEKVGLKTNDDTIRQEAESITEKEFTIANLQSLDKGAVSGHQFRAEINQLMGIIVNSLYSNRDIFVRELVSNAADALDKIRYLSLTNPSLLDDEKRLEIRIKIDPENNLIHIRDTGVGMTKEDLITNLGSIAKSGTKEFLKKIDAGKEDLTQIGQFGVGFYSSFLVADKVTVTSKHNDDDQHIWESTLDDSTAFSVAKDPRGNTLGRGTLITLHLREDAADYLKHEKLKSLIQHYNQFITFPIYLQEEREEAIPSQEEVDEKEPSEVDLEIEEDEEKPEGSTPKTRTVRDWVQINSVQPLWTRKSSDITDEEYEKFYSDSLDVGGKPLEWSHFKAEGEVEFNALLYVPETPPTGSMDFMNSKSLVKLYVKRVFISDNFEDFLPAWLNFIRGIVDSDDLPLNVSREMLQQSKLLKIIQKKLIRKVIALLQQIMEDEEKWEKFYENYHQFIKMGVVKDTSNRQRLAKLLRFHSAKSSEKMISFDKYVESMKSGQTDIYYLGGENKAALLRSPLIERLTKKGYDVLLFTSAIDEYVAMHLSTYDTKYKLVDISKEGLKLDDEDKAKQEEYNTQFAPLSEYLKETLKKHISNVAVSFKLSTYPCALVSASYGMSANMERILKAQALAEKSQIPSGNKRVLEINPRHPIIKHLLQVVQDGKQDESTSDIAHLMYDTAVLTSGFALDDPTTLANRLNKFVAESLNLDPDVAAEEEEFEVEEPESSGEKVEDKTKDPVSENAAKADRAKRQDEEPLLEEEL